MSGFWLTAVIGGLVSLVGAIYVLQVFWPGIRSMLRLDGDSAESRTQALLRRYRGRKSGQTPSEAESLPVIHIIRVAEDEDEIVVLFVNDGGAALELAVEAPAGVIVEINPTTMLARGQTGHLRFLSPGQLPEYVPFALVYVDFEGHRRTHRFAYRAGESELIDLADERASADMPGPSRQAS